MTKVLIITGSLMLPEDYSISSIMTSVQNQWNLVRISDAPWLDIAAKIDLFDQHTLLRRALKSRRLKKKPYRSAVERFFSSPRNLDVPELGEVSLATSLTSEGIEFEASTLAQLTHNQILREKLLDECSCIFLSSTYLRDTSEVELAASIVKRDSNKLVLGGALAGLIHHQWEASPSIDVLAIGYGELLVPALADWIRSDYRVLRPPPSGWIRKVGPNILLYSGYLPGKSLDALQAPDWSIAQSYHDRRFDLALYESVRGCPYRCAFCNYPFLFGDSKFRTRSAEKIAQDWEKLAEQGFRRISCLDSLFTMPRRRLLELCELLIEREIPLQWTCFARADDLTDPDVCELLSRAGCEKVLIGIESGSQEMLDNMNKRSSVVSNAQALKHCREAGITTSASVIVGFPGETEATLEETRVFLNEYPPDIFHVYTFCVRSEQMPVLAESHAGHFNLKIHHDSSTGQPYWTHSTMSCVDAVGHARSLKQELMRESQSLEGVIFYPNTLSWDRNDMPSLLQFQKDLIVEPGPVQFALEHLRNWVHSRLEADVHEKL